MTYFIGLVLLIVGYLIYDDWQKKKAVKLRKEHLAKLTKEYEAAFQSDDVSRIKTTAKNLVNSSVVNQPTLDLVYEQSLSLLKNHSDLKPFALEMGRRKYSKFRESGSPTVYDESAIMNDINAAL